jgi:hypothetical protein
VDRDSISSRVEAVVGSSFRVVEASLAAFRSVELERLVFVHFLGVFDFEHWRIPEAGSLLLSLGLFDRGSVLSASIHAAYLSGFECHLMQSSRMNPFTATPRGCIEVVSTGMVFKSNVAANEM